LQIANANPSPLVFALAALVVFLCIVGRATVPAAAEEGGTTLTPPTGPVAAEAVEKKAMALARELQVVAERNGPGAVALQAAFLIETIRAGAVGPSEVKVVGESPHQGAEFLEIDVGTGLIFDADTTDAARGADRIWLELAAPVLDKVENFAIEPAGLELVFAYGLQSFSSQMERKADLSAPHEAHSVRFVMSARALDDLVNDRISIDGLRAVATTLHD